jgi:plasmid stabilization system protein ParE
MLGMTNARVNELEAENRRLRAALLAERERADAQRSMIVNLQRQCESLVATSGATRGRVDALPTVSVLGNPLLRVCRN